MLSEERIANNKKTILELIDQIERPFDKEAFLNMLEQTDFYETPASSRFHNNFRGGLCDHTIMVYNQLKMLVMEEGLTDQISNDSIIIVALCHDLSKINFYEIYYKNQKVYCESGSKKDAGGRFDWVTVPAYKVKDADDRFIYSNHEHNSEYIAKSYIPLSTEESAAIVNHHCSISYDSVKDAGISSDVYRRYKLACLLHIADMIASFVLEETET